jgi:peptidoglycan/LPS O-acetylase OafA/YrhL
MRHRVTSLDGLRGVAALGVVVTHSLLASIDFRVEYHHEWLYPLWWGDEGVTIFFVLSGLVLTLPYIGRAFDAGAYYVSRFVRLYVPVWGAIVFAAIVHKAAGWQPITGLSWWLNLHGTALTSREAARDASLFKAGGFAYFSAIWSLKWEIIFSTLLPLAIVLGRFGRLVVPVAAVAAIIAGASGAWLYLPVFMLGVSIAFYRDQLQDAWDHHPTGRAIALVVVPRLVPNAADGRPVG